MTLWPWLELRACHFLSARTLLQSEEFLPYQVPVVLITAVNCNKHLGPQTSALLGTSSQITTGDNLINHDATACHGLVASLFSLARSLAHPNPMTQPNPFPNPIFWGLFPKASPSTNFRIDPAARLLSATDSGWEGVVITQPWHMGLVGRWQSLHIHHWRKEEKGRDLTLVFTQVTDFFVVGLMINWISHFHCLSVLKH